jgi:hypothetical protein
MAKHWQLGSYTTFDCPTEKEDEAYEYLVKEFEKIGGRVRRLWNPHDFGEYMSFEIDYPDELALIDADEKYESDDDQRLADLKDRWHDEANEIQKMYNKRFEEYL